MVSLNNIKTFDELENYLFNKMSYADSTTSNINKSFSKEEMWNMYIGECLKYKGQVLPVKTRDMMLRQIKKDFGQ